MLPLELSGGARDDDAIAGGTDSLIGGVLLSMGGRSEALPAESLGS